MFKLLTKCINYNKEHCRNCDGFAQWQHDNKIFTRVACPSWQNDNIKEEEAENE
jgi:hypothetical protein